MNVENGSMDIDGSEHGVEDGEVKNIFEVMYTGWGEEIKALSDDVVDAFREKVNALTQALDEQDQEKVDISIIYYSNEDINIYLVVHDGIVVRVDGDRFPRYLAQKIFSQDNDKEKKLKAVLQFFWKNYG